jgi:hypothetical protein
MSRVKYIHADESWNSVVFFWVHPICHVSLAQAPLPTRDNPCQSTSPSYSATNTSTPSSLCFSMFLLLYVCRPLCPVSPSDSVSPLK